MAGKVPAVKEDFDANITRTHPLRENRSCHIFYDSVILKGLYRPPKKFKTEKNENTNLFTQYAIKPWPEVTSNMTAIDRDAPKTQASPYLYLVSTSKIESNFESSTLGYVNDAKETNTSEKKNQIHH